MVGRQGVAQQWVVRADGVECARVRPGSSVEIGRRPIRPVSDDGHERVEIDDAGRSMSKRHALITVGPTCSAVVRDLHSTNGTFVVGSDGSLTRLQPDVDFLLPASPMRLQFGDVMMDFIRVEDHGDDTAGAPVKNLFGSAASTPSIDGPDLASLPVDDILNVRVGEPTVVFRTAGADSSSTTVRPETSMTSEPTSAEPVTAQGGASSDHHGEESAEASHDDAAPSSEGPVGSGSTSTQDDGSDASDGSASSAVQDASSSAADSSPVSSVPLVTGSVDVPAEPRDLFADAKAVALSVDDTSGDGSAAGASGRSSGVAAAGSAEASPTRESAGRPADSSPEISSSSAPSVIRMPSASEVGLPSTVLSGTNPVFEPGSIFSRVKKGEFDRIRPSVSVGGFTSDEAMTTTDYDEQSRMARHGELLPFLAMNPSLYDELYDWLALHQDPDIDAALERNPGYRGHGLSGKK